jgi:glutamate racemase
LSQSLRNGSTPDAAPAITIGVRDSGVGGLTVAREIKKQIPNARLLYFADTAHVPYGDRAPREVRFFALSITEFLISQGAQIVVFACNTSSAYALQIAKKRFSIPLFGMIEPGARAALEANASTPDAPIGVLATSATIQSRMYARWIENLQAENSHKTPAIEIACPRFVPLVESEQVSTPAAREACEEYLQPLLQAGARTVILGCTHYPLLLPVLKEIAPHLNFVDPAQFLAREIASLLAPGVLPAGDDADQFFVSGPRAGVENWISKLLNNPAPRICSGPVFTPSAHPEAETFLQNITTACHSEGALATEESYIAPEDSSVAKAPLE